MAMAKNKNWTFTLKDVRCFAGEQKLHIRPLTFLTGENSTGKTTVMGCFSTMYNLINYRYMRGLNFNREPYPFGGFREIVRRTKDKITSFDLGIECDDEPPVKFLFSFEEKEEDSIPNICRMNIHFEDLDLLVDTTKQKPVFQLKHKTEILEMPLSKKAFHHRPIHRIIRLFDVLHLDMAFEDVSDPKRKEKERKEDLDKWREIFEPVLKEYEKKLWHYMHDHFSESIINLAPIRSKPKRTYDPVGEELRLSPEGGEVPLFLMRLSGQKKDWKDLQTQLSRFGKTSGLFSDIEVEKYGKSGDPFQLQFKVRGVQSNIRDIGYGVSQILPLLVHLFRSPSNKRFLLQQPEVHLHPKAQAELTSLFIEAVKGGQSFLIETHSDFMIDRTCIEIKKGHIPPDQVSLIYLESLKEGVKAHNISFDKEGNLQNTPKGYRSFFLKETDRFLGIKD